MPSGRMLFCAGINGQTEASHLVKCCHCSLCSMPLASWHRTNSIWRKEGGKKAHPLSPTEARGTRRKPLKCHEHVLWCGGGMEPPRSPEISAAFCVLSTEDIKQWCRICVMGAPGGWCGRFSLVDCISEFRGNRKRGNLQCGSVKYCCKYPQAVFHKQNCQSLHR